MEQTHSVAHAPHAPPPLPPDAALFLDFDGTLAEIAPRPDWVDVSPKLLSLLLALRRRLDGAVAIVTGRRLADVDWMLAPAVLPGAGLHGAELRLAVNEVPPPIPSGATGTLALELRERFADDTRILIEDKGPVVALHFRQAPARTMDCLLAMKELTTWCDDLEVIRGNMVVEARPRGIDKGQALRTLMSRPPFVGRLPVYVGDDLTDEDGFRAVQDLGGFGVKVRPGPSVARYCCVSVSHVHEWLSAGLPRD